MHRPAAMTRLATVAVLVFSSIAVTMAVSSSPVSASVSNDDWLGIVNTYRAMSGLAPVTANPTWSAEAQAHSCYMLQNGISHDEVPGRPGYTPGGQQAGLNGNVAVTSSSSSTARTHIELWMTGPFHAIGILRHSLTASGFGICNDPNGARWKSGGTLDVLRGINPNIPRPSTPTVFPGREATVPLDRFVAESPNPVTLCGWSGEAGVPLIAMFPARVTTASASLTGPNGPVQVCALHPGNTTDATARRILEGDNAVTVVPRTRLAPGRYTATVNSSGGNVTWSFTVNPNAPLAAATPAPAPSPQPPTAAPQPAPPPPVAGPPTTTQTIGGLTQFAPLAPYRHADSRVGLRVTRLAAGQVRKVAISGADVSAVSANFTITAPTGSGYLTVFNCGGRTPEVSTLNFAAGSTANQAVVPLDAGSLCLMSTVDTHVIVDVNGLFKSTGATSRFSPSSPRRVLDTRAPSIPRLRAGETRTVPMPGAPAGATAVAVNLTVVGPAAEGYLSAFPCGGTSEVSNVNFIAGGVRPNSAVIPLAPAGTICLRSSVAADVIVDLTGSFTSSGGGLRFVPVTPLRLLDTRRAETWLNPVTQGRLLTPGRVERIKVAGVRGIPNDARAVTINLTGVGTSADGFVTVFPCGNRPDVSNLNVSPWLPAVANGAMVGLSDGDLCIYSSSATHLLIDISGVWR